jgi:hypothetical protein
LNGSQRPCDAAKIVRVWEEFYDTHPDPLVAGIWRRWNRHRTLFDRSSGFGMSDRTLELALRGKTDDARDRLNKAEDEWEATGYRPQGRSYRRRDKRRMDFFKALHKENIEYEGALTYRGINPEDEDEVETILRDYDDPPPTSSSS